MAYALITAKLPNYLLMLSVFAFIIKNLWKIMKILLKVKSHRRVRLHLIEIWLMHLFEIVILHLFDTILEVLHLFEMRLLHLFDIKWPNCCIYSTVIWRCCIHSTWCSGICCISSTHKNAMCPPPRLAFLAVRPCVRY